MFNRIIKYSMPESSSEEERRPLLIKKQGSLLKQYTLSNSSMFLGQKRVTENSITDNKGCSKCNLRHTLKEEGFDQKAIGKIIIRMK